MSFVPKGGFPPIIPPKQEKKYDEPQYGLSIGDILKVVE